MTLVMFSSPVCLAQQYPTTSVPTQIPSPAVHSQFDPSLWHSGLQVSSSAASNDHASVVSMRDVRNQTRVPGDNGNQKPAMGVVGSVSVNHQVAGSPYHRVSANVRSEDEDFGLPIPVLPEDGFDTDVPSGMQDSMCDQPFSTHSIPTAFADAVQFDHSVPQEEEPFRYKLVEGFLDVLSGPADPLAKRFAAILHMEHDEPHTELDGHAIGMQPTPRRPDLLLQWNEEFLGPGFLEQGICTPTGAIWRPSLWVFGTYRTGVNYFDSGAGDNVVEWANRLDLFTQLNLSGTERILFGLRPLDEERGPSRRFTGYDLEDGDESDGWNGDIQTLFFEGDFGEIFPRLDWEDSGMLDYGFSVGRQPMSFQQGLLLNEDRIDAVTVTRNTLNGNGNLNMRATAVYAWNSINRSNLTGGNVDDDDGQMVGLFTESDLRHSTVNADVAYVWSDDGVDDMVAFGVSGIRRFSGFHNTYNSSLHFLTSFPTNGETNLAGQGELLFSQLSWTPHHTNDLVFLNSFWAIDQFTSASRGPLGGGPLGQAGLLFSAAGLGRYGAPLNNQSSNVAGASLGYQMFFDHTKQQVVFEIGGRQDTDEVNDAAIAAGMRYQKALDQHWLVVVDAFVAKRESVNVTQGARVELQMKF